MKAGFYTDPLIHHVATSRWFNEVRDAKRGCRGRRSSLTTPTLIRLAGDDRLVSNEATLSSSREFAGAIVEVKEV